MRNNENVPNIVHASSAVAFFRTFPFALVLGNQGKHTHTHRERGREREYISCDIYTFFFTCILIIDILN